MINQELPAGLPPLPPVPEGYDRWEARGWSWNSGHAKMIAIAAIKDLRWATGFAYCSGIGGLFYLEAKKAPEKIRPTGTEKLVCDEIARRQQLGIAKYGTTVAENPLQLRAWLVHLHEEQLDAAIYTRRAIEEIDRILAAKNSC